MNNNQKSIQELLKFSIINLDKPTGPTSFSISDYVRKQLNVNKTSHFGTLDPQVSGVLPIALGRACRLNDFFMHKNKTYVGIMRLHEDVEENKLIDAVNKFIGRIEQIPPVRSRVKRAMRKREVISFKIIERQGRDVLFETEVEAGTYIRKLCDDIGKLIGGAHMLELRRTKAGMFSEKDDNFVNLYALEEAIREGEAGKEAKLRKILVPAEIALKNIMPSVEISGKLAKLLLTGKPLMKSDLSKLPNEEIFALFNKENLIAIMKRTDEKDIIARPQFVYN